MSLGIAVIFHHWSSNINRSFAAFLLSISLWGLTGSVYIALELWVPQLLLIQMIFGSLFGALFYLFSRYITNSSFKPGLADAILFAPFFIILIWNFYRMLNPDELEKFAASVQVKNLLLYREPDSIYHLYSFTILAGFIAGLTVLYRGWKKSVDASSRRQLMIILIAVISAFVSVFIFANIFTILKIQVVMIYVLIPFAASLLVITFTVLGERAWTVEKLLHIIRKDEIFLKENIRQITRLSQVDHLTGIYNRRTFYETIEIEIMRSRRYGAALSLVMFDIDHFKKINDLFGHKTGDDVLKSVTGLVKSRLRLSDHFSRWGGEEFMIILPGTDLNGAAAMAEKLRTVINAFNFPEVGSVSASFGVCEYSTPFDQEQLIKMADEALYRAKESGRDRVELYREDTVGEA
jgi:diguanylate cyclase (GGDEF)-like protein